MADHPCREYDPVRVDHMVFQFVRSVSSAGTALATGQANVRQLGTAVFTTYLFAFEATAALLVIAVVGAVLLARRERSLASEEVDE